MATGFIVLASLAGFVGGFGGWLAFDLSFVAALAIWIGSGPVAALAIIAFNRPSPDPAIAPGDSALAEA